MVQQRAARRGGIQALACHQARPCPRPAAPWQAAASGGRGLGAIHVARRCIICLTGARRVRAAGRWRRHSQLFPYAAQT